MSKTKKIKFEPDQWVEYVGKSKRILAILGDDRRLQVLEAGYGTISVNSPLSLNDGTRIRFRDLKPANAPHPVGSWIETLDGQRYLAKSASELHQRSDPRGQRSRSPKEASHPAICPATPMDETYVLAGPQELVKEIAAITLPDPSVLTMASPGDSFRGQHGTILIDLDENVVCLRDELYPRYDQAEWAIALKKSARLNKSASGNRSIRPRTPQPALPQQGEAALIKTPSGWAFADQDNLDEVFASNQGQVSIKKQKEKIQMSALNEPWLRAQLDLPASSRMAPTNRRMFKAANGNWTPVTRQQLMILLNEAQPGDQIEVEGSTLIVGPDGETLHTLSGGDVAGRAENGGMPFSKAASQNQGPSFGDELLIQYHSNNMRHEL